MKVLVCPHSLEIGGSQSNAIELAGRVREQGLDVVVFGQPGPLLSRIEQLGLDYVAASKPSVRPTPRLVAQLRRVVRQLDVDVVHAYEWPPALEATLGCLALDGVPVVATVMSMSVAPAIPTCLPLVVGTEQIAADVRTRWRAAVSVIEPPVDTIRDCPDPNWSDLGSAYRNSAGDLNIVVVGRLARELKLEGLLTAVQVVGRLGRDHPVRLLVVGDGPARPEVEEAARAVNDDLGREAVTLTGLLQDPRPAYAVADIVLGMGGSALRALAFAKPLVVQGEQGYWEVLTPDSVDEFLRQGWYGVGDGTSTGSARLEAALQPLLQSDRLRRELGRYGRALAVARFGLERAARLQSEIYRAALEDVHRASALVQLPGRCGHVAMAELRTRRRRRRGHVAVDDMNAQPAGFRRNEPQSEGAQR
jgi:glycosyltransferase involved in cell wall biosynthesis